MQTTDGTAIEFIEDSNSFESLMLKLSASGTLALDTEFVRTNTFYPLLGLVQLADKQGCYLIDPLPLNDKSSLIKLLEGTGKTFVIHSCSEDLNLLYTALGCTPRNVFDTQLAAAFLGHGFSLSYQALVEKLLGNTIPKDETRSDWLKRPLSDTQKIYAATDVCHLLEIQQMLEHDLKERGFYQWFLQECNDQIRIAPEFECAQSWQLAYTTISNAWRLNDQGLEFLQSLCIWREQEARQRNKPRNWIAKDSDLQLIAAHCAKTGDNSVPSLLSIQELDKHVANRYGSVLSALLCNAPSTNAGIDRSLLNNPLNPAARKKLKACQSVVREKAEAIGIAPELLGRKKYILDLVRGYERGDEIAWPGTASDWRRSILEEEFTRIIRNQAG